MSYPQALHGRYDMAARSWTDAIDGICSALVRACETIFWETLQFTTSPWKKRIFFVLSLRKCGSIPLRPRLLIQRAICCLCDSDTGDRNNACIYTRSCPLGLDQALASSLRKTPRCSLVIGGVTTGGEVCSRSCARRVELHHGRDGARQA